MVNQCAAVHGGAAVEVQSLACANYLPASELEEGPAGHEYFVLLGGDHEFLESIL